MIEVLLATVTFAAPAPPRETVAPLAKPVPLIVMLVPPEPGPVDGETDDTVGAGAGLV